jgi:hypothetical protein
MNVPPKRLQPLWQTTRRHISEDRNHKYTMFKIKFNSVISNLKSLMPIRLFDIDMNVSDIDMHIDLSVFCNMEIMTQT